jgi:hypothetical protein
LEYVFEVNGNTARGLSSVDEEIKRIAREGESTSGG